MNEQDKERERERLEELVGRYYGSAINIADYYSPKAFSVVHNHNYESHVAQIEFYHNGLVRVNGKITPMLLNAIGHGVNAMEAELDFNESRERA